MTPDHTRTIPRLTLLWACAAFVACTQSPQMQLARQLERAASWASAAVFGAETTEAGRTPQAFAGDLYARGAADVEQIARSIETIQVDPGERADAVRLCRQLAGALHAAQSGAANRPALGAAARDLQRFAAGARERSR